MGRRRAAKRNRRQDSREKIILAAAILSLITELVKLLAELIRR